MKYLNNPLGRFLFLLAACAFGPSITHAEDVGGRWGTEEREREYYPIVNIPIPKDLVIEAGAFCLLPDGRMAVGTRHGEIYILNGIDAKKPNPSYHLYATGLDEIFGLAYKDGAFYVTQSCELTRVTDTKHDGKANRFETISDAWGYANYHEYAFGSKFDEKGNLYVTLGLSYSYESHALFRGFAMKITPEGKTLALASGLRSPAGIGPNEHGALFYIESQGPWNCSCSLKAVTPGSFHGHPASFNWYKYAPELGPVPAMPKSGSRIIIEKERVKQLVPYAVIFPYIRMGRSITGFVVDHTKGKFGPFEDQIFLGDYTLSIIMRATTEKVNGVWQGACYPFREGLSTGILNVAFTPGGNLAVRRHEPRLASTRHQAVRPGTPRLERQNAVRNQARQHRTRWLQDRVHEAGRCRDGTRSQVLQDHHVHAPLSRGIWRPGNRANEAGRQERHTRRRRHVRDRGAGQTDPRPRL